MTNEVNENLPYISIILPIRNEKNYIHRTLEAVIQQDYPQGSMEVIVVDGMSDDGTRNIVISYQEKYPNIKLIDNPGKIVPTGINAALMVAHGEIIIRVDGHTIVSSDYVHMCFDTLQRSGADNVGGCMNAVGEGIFGEAVSQATSTPFGVGGARFHYSDREEWVDTVYMGAWPRRVFSEIGLFDEELVRDQDDEFNYRIREHGGKILLSPKIKSKYNVRSTPNTLWKQYYQYGYWKVRVLQKHPRQMRLHQFAPPAFVAALLFSAVFATLIQWGWIVFLTIAGSYILANLTVAFITAARKGWKHLPLLPIVFAILHISYGLGFLIGLFKFANRWGDKIGQVPTSESLNARTS